MTQDYINSNKIKENKYKILRMSLILGSDENREETINNFEESAREVDAMNDEIYQKDLSDKFYDTLKLEEEEKKLAVLVDYIGGRVEQRISLLTDFANITGYDLANLPPIKYYDKLDDYKERLKYIREYLSNTEQINKLTEEIEEAETKLKEAYISKATSEECNGRNEEILLSKFTNLISSLEELKNITENNIDSKLNEIIFSVQESQKSLDIFLKSYTTLRSSGISNEEAEEYKSYVDNAKDIYYSNKEQEYLLRLYKILLTRETEYSQIIIKRDSLNDILYDRINLRKELEIETNDILSSLYDLLERQYTDIEHQKENIEAIEYLNELIQNKKEDKNDLDQANQKVEILSLLREFCIIDTYMGIEEQNNIESEEIASAELTENSTTDNDIEEEFSLNNSNEEVATNDLFAPIQPTTEETTFEIKIDEPAKDNQIIAIEPATNIDLDLIQSKAGKVMKRVGEMLGIKTEETKIVSVTSDEEPPKEEPLKEEIIKEEPAPTEEFTLPNNPLPDENPLFSNNISNIGETPADPEDDSSFWFPSDMPDALNALPDLEVANNNFFGNNEIPDLNFPDLKIDFGSSDTEEKQ